MPLPFFTKTTSLENFYLGLFLKENEGVAMVLVLENGKIKIKEKERFIYSNGWENLTEDVDEVLFKIEKSLNIELDKTIFFIYSHLVNEKGTAIKKPYLDKIKGLVKNLELSPIGYIESSEAVSSFLTKKEETPLTAILVELDVSQLSIFIYKGGRLSYRKTLPRTEDLVEDLLAGFSQLKGTFLLPARIILYNSKDLNDASAKILTYRWSEDYFVQLPKVEIFKEEQLIEALVKIFEQQKAADLSSILINQQTEMTKKERLGFVIGADVSQKIDSETAVVKLSLIDKILLRLKKINLPKIEVSQRILAMIGLSFIVFGLIINEIFFHKATLTLFVPSLSIDKSTTVKIPYKIATVSAEFSESKTTSGKREVGEKAKGEVAIYNTNLNKEKIFKKGTEIEFSGLKFIFDDEVKVSTAAGATNPGVAKVKVTASSIGEEYNLPKGRRFNIDDTSYAESTSDFTGGSKRQIQTISQKDIEDLKTTIIEKAKNTPKSFPKTSGDEMIIPDLSTVSLKEAVASGEVGEELPSVSLKAKVDTTYYFYKKSQLLDKLVEMVTPEIPPGFIFNKEKISYIIKSASKDENLVLLDLSLKTKALRKISKDDVLKKITGKNKKNLNNILKSDFKVQGYNIDVKTPLPVFKNFIPFFSNNISLKISSF